MKVTRRIGLFAPFLLVSCGQAGSDGQVDASLYVVLALIGLTLTFRAVSAYLTRDDGSGTGERYGLLGGAVCPNCGRAFSRHWWAPTLLVGRLDRCPHCGKWNLVRQATSEALSRAESLSHPPDEEDPGLGSGAEEGDEDRLRRDLEESRFEDG